MNLKKTIVLILLTIILQGITGCDVALPAFNQSEQPMRFQKGYTENGLIIGTLTFPDSKPKFNGYFLKITSKNSDPKVAKKNSKELHFSPDQFFKAKHKGEMNNGLTYLFAIELPVDEYEISSFRLFTNYGTFTRDSGYSGFNIPFTSEKGEITYIGEIVFNEDGSNYDTIVSLKDNFSRDIQGLKNREKMINWNVAKKSSMKISY